MEFPSRPQLRDRICTFHPPFATSHALLPHHCVTIRYEIICLNESILSKKKKKKKETLTEYAVTMLK
jgi:hypothetical protein